MYVSPFDDDILHGDSAKYGIQAPESLEQETPGQWLPPSTFYTGNRRSLSQNKRLHRPQLVTKHWLASGKHVELPDCHMTLANLTGRSYHEAFQDLRCLHSPSPRESSPHTPSLVSDDSHSRDSPSISTPRNSLKELSLSPKLASGVALASFPSNKHSEADSALPRQSMETGSTTTSDSLSASVIQSSTSSNVFRKDVAKCVEAPVAYFASEVSMPPSRDPPGLRRSFQNSVLAFLPGAVQKLVTGPPLQQPLSYTEDDLVDYDTYLPEPSSGLGIRARAKKNSKSLSLKSGCPQCPQRFTRNFDMERHVKNIHVAQTKETIIARTCTFCGEYLSRKDAFKRHINRIPSSCILVAKKKKKPAPALLSEETYAMHKMKMLENFTLQSSHTS